MSVSLQHFVSDKWQSPTRPSCPGRSEQCLECSRRTLTIGLLNNMPDSALEATERQFLSLLNSASEGLSVKLRLYSISDISRGDAAAAHIAIGYADVEQLRKDSLDGLIVTGREPFSADLRDEPYWHSFVRVLEWAHDNTYSTVWSCLAAHAAVLHMDGISRVRSNRKHSGVFDCDQVTNHVLTSGMPSTFRLPHSRWNGLNEDELADNGYTILTRSNLAGVDTFLKHNKSLFVFFQGHPEYEPQTLLMEYRRDVGRYLRGEATAYPAVPRGYIETDAAVALLKIEREARLLPREELLKELSAVLQKVKLGHCWQATATCLYSNWLRYLIAQKELQMFGTNRPRPIAVVASRPGNAVSVAEARSANEPVVEHCIP